MTREDLQELRAMIAQIHCQLKQGALPSGLVVCYANADSAEAFERIADECDKMLAKEKKMSREECREVVELFHKLCPSLPQVKTLTDARITALGNAKALLGETSFTDYFAMVEASNFLSGRSGKWVGASFDWILTKRNLVKITEGNFLNDRGEKDSSFVVDEFYEAAIKRGQQLMEEAFKNA